ncbi:hypothetical protein SH139x_005752 [Planctomycetaceae bacterium SH139]
MIADERSFGILIAFVVPGWIGILGLSYVYPLFDAWLAGPLDASPTVGGFLFALLASVALGTGFSTIRWLIVDPLIGLTLEPTKKPHFEHLRGSHDAMRFLVESHYRFYQFHGNILIAIIIAASSRWYAMGFDQAEGGICLLTLVVLTLGARDTKSKYDLRVAELMSVTIQDKDVAEAKPKKPKKLKAVPRSVTKTLCTDPAAILGAENERSIRPD